MQRPARSSPVFLRSLSRSTPWLVAAALAACGGDDEEQATPQAPPGPPELEIESIVTPDGVRHDDFDAVPLGCSATIVVLLGPNPTPTQLVNWTLRPPGTCGATPQCGYVRVELAQDGERVLGTVTAATSATLDLGELDLTLEHTLSAELLDGSGEVFFLDGESFSDEIGVRFQQSCAEGGAGGGGGESGGGGAGGSGGETPSGGAAGGAPGPGGAAGDASGVGGAAGAPNGAGGAAGAPNGAGGVAGAPSGAGGAAGAPSGAGGAAGAP